LSHLLWFRSPAADWFEALPLGNGHLGAKVYGRVADERIALNLDDVWSGDGPRTLTVPDGPAVLADVRRLLLEDGDQLAATERTRALQGPLVIESLDSTVVLPPGWRGTVDDNGFLLLTRGSHG